MIMKERYIVDAKGKPIEVILPLKEFERLRAAAGATDPDAGLALKKKFLVELARQEKKNKRGKPLKDVIKRLDLE